MLLACMVQQSINNAQVVRRARAVFEQRSALAEICTTEVRGYNRQKGISKRSVIW